jgi:sensor c-di-GMP phosphodiesterase-like protein
LRFEALEIRKLIFPGLIQMGCYLAQGYGIARPMPPKDILKWLAQWKPSAAWIE